ncbi:hypothetical protein [Falsiroseomonas oryzae]|uniref:hypothetical protein n=1 Tax=Falsiroseomonas oryzae TaxID=2766473 RepID=UPI0022EAA513|nr:hypothetical protein [Roseomonas sp. MO-31]
MTAGGHSMPGITMAIQGLVQSVDLLTDSLERKWGVGRLRLLVDDALRERFDRQWRKWQAAYAAQDLEAVRVHSEAMRRAWAALDGASMAAGHVPMAPEVWETRMPDGSVLAIVRGPAEQHALPRAKGQGGDGRAREVWSLDEIGRVICAWEGRNWVEAVRAEFPGAKVEALRLTPRGAEFDWSRGDEIPFGHETGDTHADTPLSRRATR